MTTIEKIRAEIRRLYAEDSDRHIVRTSLEALSNLMDFLDTLEEPVSEDLEEAANQYIGYPPEIDEGVITAARRIAFKAGAEWQKNQQPLRFLEIPAGDVAPAEEEGGPWEEDEQ